MIDSSVLRQVPGMPVVGADGRTIGKATAAYEAADGSGGTFATVATGLFGSSASFFPLHEAQVQDAALVVPYTAEQVQRAQRVAPDEELDAPEERRLLEHYGLLDDTAAAAGSGGPAEVVRSEERLRVGTERVETGRARLRKYVVTETQTRTLPLSHDELRVEREPVTGAVAGLVLGDEEHELVLTEERPLVQKEAVPVERVRLDVDRVQEQVQVSEQVRKEQVDVDTEGPAGRRPAAAAAEQEVVTEVHDELVIEPRH